MAVGGSGRRSPEDPPHWTGPQYRHISSVDPTAWVSQYGRVRADGTYEFREQPRFDRRTPIEDDISMLLGKCTPEEAGMAVRGMNPPARIRIRERVRWFRVGDLIEADYLVMRTPTPRNPAHVSVLAPIEPEQAHELVINQAWWVNPTRVTLESLTWGIGGDPT